MAEPPETLPPGHSALRSMIEGSDYTAYDDLAAAREQEGVVVIFEGDDGGTIYLTAPIAIVQCDEAVLRQLLFDIDRMCWKDSDSTGVFFEHRAINSGVAGGMGGGVITDGLWLHREVEAMGIRREIEEVFERKRKRIRSTGLDWNKVNSRPIQL